MAREIIYNKKLYYEIHKYSSYSTSYLPENIREDCPTNQTSRWSSHNNSPPQFLTLKLQRPAVVKKIKFGKYEKSDVCNLRKFKIYGGLEDEHFVLLFEGGLKNDALPEIFNLKHKTDSGELFPILYLQIVPLLSWAPSFNFSIWYVELLGQDDPIYVRTSLRNYNSLREVEIIRLCLKHFRQQGYETAFEALLNQTNVFLEHPIMSDLHNALVINGDFVKTEDFIDRFVAEGLMDAYLLRQDYKASWILQESNNIEKRPGMRGGHQLNIDSTNGIMYLYGGWDGFEDLSDLWSYDIKHGIWTLIHEHSEQFDGPTPRSCHKMVFDSHNGQIFIFGRYLESSSRTPEFIKSDFYLFDTKTQTWLLICDDTSQVGGPQLIFDHQMCIDLVKQMIYVFGGRILTPRNIDDLSNDPQYSGLYSYHIGTNTWTQILVDCAHPLASNPEVLSIKSRVTHSMVFHHRHRKLYIFGGQRNKEYTIEFISFDVDSQEMTIVNGSNLPIDGKNVPPAGHTQRATIDCERDEIYVLSSLSKEKERRDLNLNSFWMYSLKTNEWTCIFRSDHSTEQCYSKAQSTCTDPCPRYAHQLVYDWNNRVHYLFGGNPGKNTSPQLRLDDFWILMLDKPSRQQIQRHCKYLIRRQEYEEIAKTDVMRALNYLQTNLSEIIDHKDPIELTEFHKLASLLFRIDCSQSKKSSLITSPIHHGSNVNLGSSSSSINSNDCTNRSSSSTISQNTPYSRCNSTVCCAGRKGSTTFDNDDDSGGESCRVGINLNDIKMQNDNCFDEKQYEIKIQRCLLFNKIVELLPENMVQPKSNLSDFVLI